VPNAKMLKKKKSRNFIQSFPQSRMHFFMPPSASK